MDHIKDLLSEFIDDALADADRRKVDAHLLTCEECRRELAELKSVSKMVAKLKSKPLPAGFMERLEKRRASEEMAGIVPPWLLNTANTWWLRPLSVAVCAMGVLVITLDQMNRRTASRPLELQTTTAKYDQLKEAKAFAGAGGSAGGRAVAENASAMPATSSLMAPQAGVDRLDQAFDAKKLERTAYEPKPPATPQRFAAQSAPAQGLLKTQVAAVRGAAPAPASLAAKDGAAREELEYRKTSDLAADANKQPVAAQALAAPRAMQKKGSSESRAKARRAPTGMGWVLHSAEELNAAWTRFHIPESPPVANFESEMIVLVRAEAPGARPEIIDIKESAGRLVVSYKEIVLNVQGEPPSPYEFRVVDKTSLPVVFQKQP